MKLRHALDLTFSREALVEALGAELAHLLGPRRQAVLPARNAPGFGFGVVARQVGAGADHRLDRDRLGDHVVFFTPGRVRESGTCGLQEVADHTVVAVDIARAAARHLDATPVRAHPPVDLVEKLRLQHPLIALAAAAEAVDAVTERAVAFGRTLLDEARGKLAVGRRP